MSPFVAGDVGPYIAGLLADIPDEDLLGLDSFRGRTLAWFEARGFRPNLAAVTAERDRRLRSLEGAA